MFIGIWHKWYKHQNAILLSTTILVMFIFICLNLMNASVIGELADFVLVAQDHIENQNWKKKYPCYWEWDLMRFRFLLCFFFLFLFLVSLLWCSEISAYALCFSCYLFHNSHFYNNSNIVIMFQLFSLDLFVFSLKTTGHL